MFDVFETKVQPEEIISEEYTDWMLLFTQAYSFLIKKNSKGVE